MIQVTEDRIDLKGMTIDVRIAWPQNLIPLRHFLLMSCRSGRCCLSFLPRFCSAASYRRKKVCWCSCVAVIGSDVSGCRRCLACNTPSIDHEGRGRERNRNEKKEFGPSDYLYVASRNDSCRATHLYLLLIICTTLDKYWGSERHYSVCP